MVVLFRRRTTAGQAPDPPLPDDLTVRYVVEQRLVGTEFQPIVRLQNREVAGYEAVARGPVDTPFEDAAALSEAARAAGIGGELDLVSHAAALTGAIEGGLPATASLFITANPRSLGRRLPEDLAIALVNAVPRVRVFMELPEDALTEDPRATLACIDKARACGWGICLKNPGTTPESLALLPFARPDVVKIDVSLLHLRPHPHIARVLTAVSGHLERTQGTIMAVGLDTEAHLRTARGMGAAFGQGELFGRPGALPAHPRTPQDAIPLIEQVPATRPEDTPFRLATEREPAVPATAAVVGTLAGHLEQRASVDPDPNVVLVCLPRGELLSGAPLGFLQIVARGASYVALIVGERPAHGLPDVRTVVLGRDDPLRDELAIILLGPQYAAMLTARERSIGRPQAGYEYRLVHDRDTVTRSAAAILQRVTGAPA